MPVGKLESVDLREIWKHEEKGFSSWLEKNIETLGETLGLSLSPVQAEKPVGPFSVDLVAEDGDGNLVVIENQLESTDHDHLGKVLVYLTNLDAKIAIWITKSGRPEHVRAVEWLNEVSPADIAFYLVRLSAFRIGLSDPAPLFTIIAGPSIEAKDIGGTKEDLAERHILRLKFWEQILGRAKECGLASHANRGPSKDSWLGGSSGKSGLSLNFLIWLQEKSAVELYIDTGEREKNKRIFDQLSVEKGSIEVTFGSPLSWERMDDRKASRIRYTMNLGGLKDGESRWPQIQEALIDAMWLC